ncbi:MAG TPA: hypothetical protein VG347_22105 [Verrucomicrobiae bacterium]|nr:hypothetical protein [Verrucomicrobiae bacterium]
MKTIHRGKIARLPAEIREEVNRRLASHESGTAILSWLNALPEVRAVLAAAFGGKAINGYNLYKWRHGGFAEWRQLQDAQAVMERVGPETAQINGAAARPVTETLATWVAVRYVVAMKRAQSEGGDPMVAWNRLRECCHDMMALQRGEQRARRLELVRAGLALRGGETGGKAEDGENDEI